jgi:hypothetical protein
MSHYISASFGKERKEGTDLSGGVSWRTLSALEESGIDIYFLYDGSEHHAGMSGDGSEVEVSAEKCLKAYQTVIAWVMAMRKCYPEAYHQEYGEVDPIPPESPPLAKEIDEIVANHPFAPKEVAPLFEDFSEDLKNYPITGDTLDRSMGYLWCVLHFSKNIYEFTSITQEEVYVGFC